MSQVVLVAGFRLLMWSRVRKSFLFTVITVLGRKQKATGKKEKAEILWLCTSPVVLRMPRQWIVEQELRGVLQLCSQTAHKATEHGTGPVI